FIRTTKQMNTRPFLTVFVIASLSLNAQPLFAQPKLDTATIKKELVQVWERDQAGLRSALDPQRSKQDPDLVHFDSLTMLRKNLPMLEQSAEAGETEGQYLALLKDRILMRDKQQQIYGTQIWRNPRTNKREVWPIEEEINVNVRRSKLGLMPLEEYLKILG